MTVKCNAYVYIVRYYIKKPKSRRTLHSDITIILWNVANLPVDDSKMYILLFIAGTPITTNSQTIQSTTFKWASIYHPINSNREFKWRSHTTLIANP